MQDKEIKSESTTSTPPPRIWAWDDLTSESKDFNKSLEIEKALMPHMVKHPQSSADGLTLYTFGVGHGKRRRESEE